MHDREQARALLRKAREDLQAVEHMLDPEEFSNGVFGFHVQQTLEKSLKAWIASKGAEYPFRHDIAELVSLLAKLGEDVAALRGLARYTPFALQLRYEDDAPSPPRLDRRAALEEARAVVQRVEKAVG
ncbi:MAG: HEPN domain-containing protein [Bdellovibrionota bacterium]